MKFSEELLKKIIDSLDLSFRNVIEFRDESWWRVSVYEELSKHNISFCGMSHPHLPDKIISNSKIIYYRFHGSPKLYYSQYKRKFIEHIAEQIHLEKKITQAYLYFNNTADIGAIRNAKYMQGIVRRET